MKEKIKTFGRTLTPLYLFKEVGRLEEEKKLSEKNFWTNFWISEALLCALVFTPIIYGIRVHETKEWSLSNQSKVYQEQKFKREQKNKLIEYVDLNKDGFRSIGELSTFYYLIGVNPDTVNPHSFCPFGTQGDVDRLSIDKVVELNEMYEARK